jgi:hypothetical protein
MVQYAPTNDATGIKVVHDGKIGVMVAYDHWTPASVQMHIYISDKKSFTRHVIQEAMAYPLIQAGRDLLIVVIPSDNKASLSLVRRVGWKETYRVKDGWESGVDMVLHEMRKSDCKWLKGYGRVPAAGALRPTSRSLRMANG